MRPLRTYLNSLRPQLPREAQVLLAGGLVNAFGNGVVVPFLIIYLHNVPGIALAVAGLAAATQSAAALISGFAAGTLSDRVGPKRVLVGALLVMTLAFALMPLIRSPWQAFAIYVVWGAGSGSFWPSHSSRTRRSTPCSWPRPSP
jgi:MFS family permease